MISYLAAVDAWILSEPADEAEAWEQVLRAKANLGRA
jgi:hypothetical protein